MKGVPTWPSLQLAAVRRALETRRDLQRKKRKGKKKENGGNSVNGMNLRRTGRRNCVIMHSCSRKTTPAPERENVTVSLENGSISILKLCWLLFGYEICKQEPYFCLVCFWSTGPLCPAPVAAGLWPSD